MADVTKIYDKGNFDLITAKLDESTNTYGAVYKWNGLMEINIDLTQNSAQVSADDDPAYLDLKGPITGTGTIKIVGIKNDEFAQLIPVTKDKNGAILFGEDLPSVVLGLSFLNQHFENDTTSTNKTTFYKVTCAIPSMPTASVDSDGTTITEVSIPVTINPYFYEDNGEKKRVTMSKLNSVANKDIWSTAKDTIYVPTGTSLE